MEPKTMGRFIAALRKAESLTQKDMADRLNVSDKAVSRWERDENYPDLSLLPALAELFDVTADELLRGERIPQTAKNDESVQEKTEQQTENLLRSTYATFRTYWWVSILLLVVGCFTIFLYFIGIIFIVAAPILLIIQYNGAKNKVQNTDLLLDERTVATFLAKIRSSVWQVISSILVLPALMGLAFWGNQILNHLYYNNRFSVNGYGELINMVIIYFLSILGTSIGPMFPFRAILPIVLLNIWFPYRFNKKYPDVVCKDCTAQAHVHKLARMAVIVGIACFIALNLIKYIIEKIVPWSILMNNWIVLAYALLLPISLLIVYMVYRKKRKRYMKSKTVF